MIITGNENLDYILNQKLMECKNRGIDLKFILEKVDINFIKDSDLFIMLGNLLDNAIEHTSDKNIPIVLSITKKLNMIFIICTNATEINDSTLSNSTLISTKSDKLLHGYGISSIQMIANKYNGNFTYKIENNSFIATVCYAEDS